MKGLKMSKISNERIYEVIRSPLISEKATFVSQFNHYVFKVAVDSSKPEIKEAIQSIFKVEVKSVNTLNQKGKKKRFRGKVGTRPGVKKAYIKLAEGQTIDTTLEVK
jgi:large subunit ribosomal protein L23|tara:strand:+ start:823 stop:1143 length:321 start_codon:yes stop_codon:yes gene_type:complete